MPAAETLLKLFRERSPGEALNVNRKILAGIYSARRALMRQRAFKVARAG
ncbi:MAG: hypothetical protein ABR577_13920 [Pyrinomonadaceae bacterium]